MRWNMELVTFTLNMPIKIKKKENIYVSSCPVVDVWSQGFSEKEAKDNLIEAVRLFLTTCYEMGTLDAVLKEGSAPL
jgi:predicted RNase H-like HicB family nuclease